MAFAQDGEREVSNAIQHCFEIVHRPLPRGINRRRTQHLPQPQRKPQRNRSNFRQLAHGSFIGAC
jgi:hypothetical protein